MKNNPDIRHENMNSFTSPQTHSDSVAGRGLSTTIAEKRWIDGHQLFYIIMQGLNEAWHQLTQSVGRNDLEEAAIHLSRVKCLLKVSAVAMKFTGDFEPEEYLSTVRPSMPKNFSGLMNADHFYLTKQYPLLKKQGPPAEMLEEIKRAINELYIAHSYVCEKFVGRNEPSLLANETHPENSAVEQTHRFRERRVGSVTHDGCPFPHASDPKVKKCKKETSRPATLEETIKREATSGNIHLLPPDAYKMEHRPVRLEQIHPKFSLLVTSPDTLENDELYQIISECILPLEDLPVSLIKFKNKRWNEQDEFFEISRVAVDGHSSLVFIKGILRVYKLFLEHLKHSHSLSESEISLLKSGLKEMLLLIKDHQ